MMNEELISVPFALLKRAGAAINLVFTDKFKREINGRIVK